MRLVHSFLFVGAVWVVRPRLETVRCEFSEFPTMGQDACDEVGLFSRFLGVTNTFLL